MASDYDLAAAFGAIEEELIASMMRNLSRHRVEEDKLGYNWSAWQIEQLKALEKYKKKNQQKYAAKFKDLNDQIDDLIRTARAEGGMAQEIAILNAIKQGFPAKRVSKGATAEFFKLNDRKLEALVKATVEDMQRAETAILRRANDQYRKIIYNAQVYANTGAGTYAKAVDMATKDFLKRGIDCIEYKNGSRHTIGDYADMAIRTASKRAYLTGEGEKRKEWGISTVIVNKRGNPCPKCLPFCGKVLIDDVWSGGSKDGVDPETGKKYPTMSYAISQGLYHPRCKDSHATYFPGISSADDTWTKKELENVGLRAKQEARQQHAERQAEKFGRLAKYSLDEENQNLYTSREKQWRNVRFKTGGLSSKKYAESKRPLANFRAVPENQATKILMKDSEEWIKGLTKEERRAIRKYTYNSGDKKPNRFFERLNAMLRGDLPEDERLREYANTISKAIKKNKLQHDIICYRNLDINIYKDFDKGDILEEAQFISTSVVESSALSKPYKVTLYVPKGSSCAYIESISKFPKQNELLLDKGCKFKVLSKKEKEIELEVIP